jgi:hypothetical protein
LFAAVVLLLLTFAQTFYGVYAYYRPSSWLQWGFLDSLFVFLELQFLN